MKSTTQRYIYLSQNTIFRGNSSLIFLFLLVSQLLKSQPVINSISPSTGAVGSTVVISGNNFNTTASLNIVYFGATAAQVINASVNSITVTVPYGANHVPVSVLNTGNQLMGHSAQFFQSTFFCPSTPTNSSFSRFDMSGGQNSDIEVGDLDGDGKTDVALALTNSGTNGTVSVYRSISVAGVINNSSFASVHNIAVLNPTAIKLTDVNGDGRLDIVSCSYYNNDVTILRNTSTPGLLSFASPSVFPLSGGFRPTALAVEDLDMDGKPDIVTADNSPGHVSIIKNNCVGNVLSLAASVDYTVASQPMDVVIVDVDGDGKKDLAVANTHSGVSVFRNITTTGLINSGSFAPQVMFPVSAGAGGIDYGDLDGDLKMDLVVSSVINGTVTVLRNIASPGSITLGSFAPAVTFGLPGNSISTFVGDVTGDGKPEVIVPTISASSVSILQNLCSPGTINLSSAVNYLTGVGNKPVCSGDVDNDGKNEILVAASFGSVSIHQNLMGLNASAVISSVSCNGGSDGQIQVTATTVNSVSILWSNSAQTFSLNNLPAGNYNYSVSSGTCMLTQSLSILQPAPVPVTVISSGTLLCEGQTATLSAGGASTYSWSTGTSGQSITVSPTVTTSYVVTGTLNGCSNTATVIQNVAAFTVSATSAGTLLCEGETTTLTANGAATYSWHGAGGGATIAVQPSVTTIYTLTGTDVNGCIKTTTLMQQVSLFTLSANSSHSLICEGQTSTLTANGASSYSWNGAAGVASITVQPGVTTTYTFTGINADGCLKTGTLVQPVSVFPLTAASENSVLCEGETTTLTGNGASSYTWAGEVGGASIVIQPTLTTTYTLSGINADGCAKTITLSQVVSPCVGFKKSSVSEYDLHVYPNPHAGKFEFRLTSLEQGMEFEIFDAMGTLIERGIVKSNETSVDLEEVPSGVYFLRVTSFGDQIYVRKVIKSKN